MKEIQEYRNRFYNLLESEMGNVKPLISETVLNAKKTEEVIDLKFDFCFDLDKYPNLRNVTGGSLKTIRGLLFIKAGLVGEFLTFGIGTIEIPLEDFWVFVGEYCDNKTSEIYYGIPRIDNDNHLLVIDYLFNSECNPSDQANFKETEVYKQWEKLKQYLNESK